MKYYLILILVVVLACCAPSEKKRAIAILTPVTHPSLELAEKGFIDSIGQGKYRFEVYNAQGNMTLMRSQVEEIARKQFDLVLTIGTTATLMTAEVFAKKGLATPQVFTAVNGEVTGAHVTGVKEMLNFEAEIEALLQFKPALSQVLLVYNPAEPGLQKDREEVEQILKRRQIALKTVEVFQTNELKAKVPPFMEKCDALIVLKDNTVVAGIEVLAKLCREKKIPLMASDLDSPARGATLGYGVNEAEFGIEAAKKALKILEEGVPPGEIPVTPVNNFKLLINPEATK